MTWILGLWVGAVAGCDCARNRIPNALLVLLLLGSLASLVFTGTGLLHLSWVQSLSGTLLALALTLPGYAGRQLGAGDVKLAACLGFVLGPMATLETLLVAAVVLGLMSAFALLMKRDEERWRRIPAAPALAAGVAATLALGPLLPHVVS